MGERHPVTRRTSRAPAPLRAVTFDFWDTLYDGASLPERRALRQSAVRTMLERIGASLPDDTVHAAYVASAREADRWWREEHRGYTTAERIHYFLGQLGLSRPQDCEHVQWLCEAIDASLLRHPPPLLRGARDLIEAIASRFPIAIISDTGFSSSRAQDALLEQDGLLDHFSATIYSMDVGHAKPRPEPFAAATVALGVESGAILHVGDNERTDVGGALAAGFRAIRLDVVRRSGPSAGEMVAASFEELGEWLEGAASAAHDSRCRTGLTPDP
jgi:putative hydrolase of the HAD superfamily